MPQGNPEGLKSPIPQDIQEIILAAIHKLFSLGKHGFSFTCKEDRDVFVITKADRTAFGVIPYAYAREGGVDLLIEYATFIEEQFDDGIEAEVQEDQSASQGGEAISR